MDRQSVELWNALKRVLHYLKGTIHYGIIIYSNNMLHVKTFSDADWGGDLAERKSTTGLLVLYGMTPIIGQSKKQSTVATSSTAAEYIAISEASKWVYWLDSILKELSILKAKPFIVHTDSLSALSQAYDPAIKSRAKHIDVRYHYFKDLIETGLITLTHVSTDEMLADVFTKPLSKQLFIKFCQQIGIVDTLSPAQMSGSVAGGTSLPLPLVASS